MRACALDRHNPSGVNAMRNWTSTTYRRRPWARRALTALTVTFGCGAPALVAAQERHITLAGAGTLVRGTRGAIDVRSARLSFRGGTDFTATLVAHAETVVVAGRWQRPAVGNVDRLDVRGVDGRSVRGSGSLTYTDAARTRPRRLQLDWTDRAGSHHVDLVARDADPATPTDAWRAGSGGRVDRNIDARALGEGRARMTGLRDGAYTVVRVRVATGGDAIIDVDRPTRGEIRGRVQRVDGPRIVLAIRSVFGYTASGTATVQLRDAGEVERLSGRGEGERGSWSLDFRGTGVPNDLPLPSGDNPATVALFMDRNERGRGLLAPSSGTALEIGRASVRLGRGRDGTITLEARREQVVIDGRWLEASGGRVQFEIARVNKREASGRLTVRRDRQSFSAIEGDGRSQQGRFVLVFVTQ